VAGCLNEPQKLPVAQHAPNPASVRIGVEPGEVGNPILPCPAVQGKPAPELLYGTDVVRQCP
jgi:hypothetical protein